MPRALPSRLPVLAVLALDAWLCVELARLPVRVRLAPPRAHAAFASWSPCAPVREPLEGWRTVLVGASRLSVRASEGPGWPAYRFARGPLASRFEADRALSLASCRFREDSSSLLVADSAGRELRFEGPSLAPQGARVPRAQLLAGLLGVEQLTLLLGSLLGGHLCLWVGERWRARGEWQGRLASFVNMLAVFLAGVSVLLLWWARTRGA